MVQKKTLKAQKKKNSNTNTANPPIIIDLTEENDKSNNYTVTQNSQEPKEMDISRPTDVEITKVARAVETAVKAIGSMAEANSQNMLNIDTVNGNKGKQNK